MNKQQWWYNFIMENVFDQEYVSPEVAKEIVEGITSEQTIDFLAEEDYTKVDESEVDWAAL
jgi:hypothetical protein